MTYLSNYVEQSPFQEVTGKSCVTFHNIPIPYIPYSKPGGPPLSAIRERFIRNADNHRSDMETD
jgi:hypothetical protein